jgi:hypothetical protein
LVETDVMAEQGQPVLSPVSRLLLNDRGSIIDKWASGHFGHWVDWMVQQLSAPEFMVYWCTYCGGGHSHDNGRSGVMAVLQEGIASPEHAAFVAKLGAASVRAGAQ